MERVWKDVPGFENIYQVSNDGLVKHLPRLLKNNNGTTRYSPESLVKQNVKRGYYAVVLRKEDERKDYYVHKLVATVFISNPDNKPCVDHIDTNPKNNNVENLRWCTIKENANNPLTKKHLSDMMLGNKRALGNKRSEEGKKRLSDALHRRIVSEETKRKISLAKKGRVMCEWTEERRLKLSKSLKGLKTNQPIVQRSLDGEYIREWPSVRTAAKELEIQAGAIYQNLSGRSQSSAGYVWTWL